MLKKSLLVVALLLIATNVWAVVVRPLDVSAGAHNLGLSGDDPSGGFDNEDEVCIFCHTPHGGSNAGPLWNRTMPAANGFTHYTSANLSPAMAGLATNRNVNPESLLCMSCHDGTIGMNSIINNSNRTGAAPFRAGPPEMFDPSFGFGSSPVIGEPIAAGGQSLTDDHPISFSYYDASLPANNDKLYPADGIPAGNDPRLKGIRLFGADAALGQRVECSSCHDPHVNYSATGDPNFAPFLVMSNVGSALCLACHIK